MRASHFAFLLVLGTSSQLLAQHHESGGSSSAGGSSMGSSSSGGSMSSSSSTASYSGSSSSSSSSSGSSGNSSSSSSSSHSSGSSSGGSGSASSRGSDSSSGSSSRGSANHSASDGGGTSRSNDSSRVGRSVDARDTDTNRKASAPSAPNDRLKSDAKSSRGDTPVNEKTNDRERLKSGSTGQTDAKHEKRSIFTFWRHAPKDKKPDPRKTLDADKTPPKRCRAGQTCPVCPAGEVSEGGHCVSQPVASNVCPPNETSVGGQCSHTPNCGVNSTWDGRTCSSPFENCDTNGSFGGALWLANEMLRWRGRMQMACASDPGGQECQDLTELYQKALISYRLAVAEIPQACRGRLPDPPII